MGFAGIPCAIVTGHCQQRDLTPQRLRSIMQEAVIVDSRNALSGEHGCDGDLVMRALGKPVWRVTGLELGASTLQSSGLR